MIIKKLKVAALLGGFIFASSPVAHAKGASVSAGRSSVSVSSSRSYNRPTSTYKQTTTRSIVTPKQSVSSTTTTKRRSSGEYEYFALNDCKRIVKPINGYRCFDRD